MGSSLSTHRPDVRNPGEWPVRGGVIAGSIASLVAVLVSLPLRSPDDALLNSATVMVATVIAGGVAGLLWRALANSARRWPLFAVLWALGFVLAVLFAVAGETQLDRMVSFTVPLAAIVFPLIGVLTVILARWGIASRWWVTAAVLTVALGVGVGLSGRGDEKSGRLELPPRASVSIPSQPYRLGYQVRLGEGPPRILNLTLGDLEVHT